MECAPNLPATAPPSANLSFPQGHIQPDRSFPEGERTSLVLTLRDYQQSAVDATLAALERGVIPTGHEPASSPHRLGDRLAPPVVAGQGGDDRWLVDQLATALDEHLLQLAQIGEDTVGQGLANLGPEPLRGL